MSTSETHAVPSRELSRKNQPTWEQITFDVLAGIVLPLFCIVADPIVFRPDEYGESLLGNISIVGYSVIAIGVLSLSTWLLFEKFPAVFAGLLIGSAIYATLLGVLLLPISVAGLMFLIGVLGFSPFVTAFVFWRNSLRAYKMAGDLRHPTQQFISMMSVILVLLAPWSAQSYCNRRVAMAILHIESGEPLKVSKGVDFFRKYRILVSTAPLMAAYQRTGDEVQRQGFSRAFHTITGKDLEEELERLDD